MLSPSRELRRRSTRPPRSCSIEKVREGSRVSHPMRVRLQGPPLSHWNSTRALVSRKPSPKTKKGMDRSRTPAPARNSEREGVMGGGGTRERRGAVLLTNAHPHGPECPPAAPHRPEGVTGRRFQGNDRGSARARRRDEGGGGVPQGARGEGDRRAGAAAGSARPGAGAHPGGGRVRDGQGGGGHGQGGRPGSAWPSAPGGGPPHRRARVPGRGGGGGRLGERLEGGGRGGAPGPSAVSGGVMRAVQPGPRGLVRGGPVLRGRPPGRAWLLSGVLRRG